MNIRRALILTADSTNLHKLAPFLQEQGIEIVSAGDNLKYLKQHRVTVTTLTTDQLEFVAFNDFGEFDLLVMNLNDIENEISKPDSTLQTITNVIAVDTLQMLQAAAAQYENVITLINPSDYDDFMFKYAANPTFSVKQRLQYAQKIFAQIAKYNELVAQYFYLSLMRA